MSDPATDPRHDLTRFPQDEPQPRVRLGTFLALLRILAGRRGQAGAVWNRDGYTYSVLCVREDAPGQLVLDGDDDAPGGDVARARLRDALDAHQP